MQGIHNAIDQVAIGFPECSDCMFRGCVIHLSALK